jgi:methyl-accepting chemotaxis protein
VEDDVNWTVNRRIAVGFSFSLVLVALITAIAFWALDRTRTSYAAAIQAERELLLTAVDARGAVRGANIAYLRGLVEEGGEHLAAKDSAVAVAFVLLQRLESDAIEAEARRTWSEAARLLGEWDAAVSRIVTLYRENNVEQALSLRREQAQPLRQRLEMTAARGITLAQQSTDRRTVRAEDTSRAAERALLIGVLLLLGVGISSAYFLTRAINAPLQEVSSVLASSASEILAATTQQASGATESLAAVTETAATVDEVVQTADQAADRARAVSSSAQRAAEIGRQGRQAVDDSVAAMDTVREHVDDIGASIRELAGQAQAISEIIGTVNDLADQTNLLALNAAIEAARAGEQGRGFAIVAGEVKSLAEQSKSATVRVRQILNEVQQATAAAVRAVDQGTEQVVEGTRQASEAGATIRSLAEAINGAAQAAAQIAASAGQQSTGMNQVRQAIANIQQAAQQNLAATRQSESAAHDLNRVGERFVELVGRRDGAART